MVSPRKQIANQANAAKSTGPRTVDGKARSSQNRLTHGFFSARVVLEGEDRAQYDALLADLVGEHRPQTPTQMGCVQRVADCTWKLWRIEAGASHMHERRAMTVRHEAAQWAEDTGNAMRGARMDRWETLWHADPAQLQRLRERFQQLVVCAPAAATLAASMVEPRHSPGGSGEFDRLLRYEQRLQNMLHRALAELRKLREERAEVEALPTSPYVSMSHSQRDDGESSQSEIVRNEPAVETAPAASIPMTADPKLVTRGTPPGARCVERPGEGPIVRNEPTAEAPDAPRASSG